MRENTGRPRSAQRLFLTAAAAAAASMVGTSARAGGPVYWDPTNGTAPGTGAANPAGTWNTTDARWGDADGTATPVAWNNANGDTAVFAAGNDATGSYSVTSSGTLSLAGITMEEGTTVTLAQSGTVNYTLAGPDASMVVDVQGSLLVVNGRYNGNLITKTGPGILNSGSAQTSSFSGKWAVIGGSLSFGADLRIGVAPAELQPDAITVSSGGKFRTGAATPTTSIHALRGMTIGAGGGGFDTPFDTGTSQFLTTVWNGPITGSVGGDLQMTGLGTVVLTNTNNNYDGNTTISAGAIRLGTSGVIPDTSVVSQTGGTFDMATNSATEIVKSISGTAGTIALGFTSSLIIDDPAGETAAQTLNVPSGALIIKNGSGALTLSGGAANNNSTSGFNGEFVLNDGTLGIGTSTMLGGANTPTATLTINGGRLSNADGDAKNFNAALVTNLNGDFIVGTNLFATPGIIRFNGGTQTIRNSNRTITVNGLANLDLAGVVAEDVPGRSLTKEGTGILQLTNVANTYTGGTIVNAGTLVVSRMHENNPVTINAGLLKIRDSSPTLPAHPAGNDAFVSRPSALSIAAGATLDITNNDVVLDYSGASPIATYEALVASAYNVGVGDWSGTGITSSVAQADGNYVVAIADNATLAAPFGTANGGPLFAGVDVDIDTILIKFTHRADVDLDGVITPNDAAIFGGNYSENDPAVWVTGDMDYDGVFTPNDAAIFGGFYDESLASLPEPGSLAALGLIGVGFARRRRRRM